MVWRRAATILLVAAVALAADGLERARQLYNRTDYLGAVEILKKLEPKTAAAWQLMGRAYYMAGDYKKATECLEKAVALDPQNSQAYHWLGQAWGRRAETSSWFTAIQYARKTREAFERAVQLDPANAEAVNDLFEYYLEAPGFLGGGLDKAAGLIERIRALDPVEYHFAMARIAEKRKEYAKAEEQLRRAVELAPRQAGRVLDLAKFLAKQGRFQESDAVFEQARKLASESPKVLFEEAKTYINSKRNLALAQELLKRYLESPLTPDDPPRSEALKLLRQVQGG